MTSTFREILIVWASIVVMTFVAVSKGDYYSDNYLDYNTKESGFRLKDYSGDLETMPNILGDWWGHRNELARQGIIFEGGFTGVAQINTRGGTNTSEASGSGGSADYWLMLDTERLGCWKGGMWTFHGETIFGQNVFNEIESVLPVNYDALLPRPDAGLTTLSELFLTQRFGDDVIVNVGKMDPLNIVDRNRFANDERRQFMSTGFRANPVIFPLHQYTALGVSLEYSPSIAYSVALFAFDNNATVRKSGFDTAFESPQGTTVGAELRLNVEPCDYPGTQRFGYSYSDRNFQRLDPDFRINLPGNTTTDIKQEDYVFWYNFDQYIFTEKENPTQGVGLFGRYGYSNGEANVLDEFFSFGIGGKGPLEGRDKDTWGAGYYYAGTSGGFPESTKLDNEEGVEIYYAAQMTESIQVTQALTWINDPGAGGRPDVNGDAIVLGLRVQVDF